MNEIPISYFLVLSAILFGLGVEVRVCTREAMALCAKSRSWPMPRLLYLLTAVPADRTAWRAEATALADAR